MKPRHLLFAATALAISAAVIGATLTPVPIVENPEGLLIHEWGTFTSVQNERGESIPGINVDDEPVPDFVHTQGGPFDIGRVSDVPSRVSTGYKGVMSQPLLDITMRLETPVIYFHLPANTARARVDVTVKFPGGLLTQFYPMNTPSTDATENIWAGKIDGKTPGGLTWKNVIIGGSGNMRTTTDPVWTSPRAVNSGPVTVQTPSLNNVPEEHEQFIFYRGVGHLDAPIRVVREQDTLTLTANLGDGPQTVPAAWLADIRDDGQIAFRAVGPVTLQGQNAAKQIAASFKEQDYSAGAMTDLREALKKSLQADGMNADEADALLNTWEHSYFKTAGLRLLFMVPRSWTDQALPLSVSAPKAIIKRAMVGRIEIMTPQQRAAIATIKAGPFGGAGWLTSLPMKLMANNEVGLKIINGHLPLSAVNVTLPADYMAYLSLGRFRQAILLDAQKQDTTPALDAFIDAYKLEAWKAPDADPSTKGQSPF